MFNFVLSQIFGDLVVENKVFIYVDDFLVVSLTFDEHMEILEEVFK